MDEKKLRFLRWTELDDWSNLQTIPVECSKDEWVSEENIKSYIKDLIKSFSSKLETSEILFRQIFKGQNSVFFSEMEQLFKEQCEYRKDDPSLHSLFETLVVPVIPTDTIPEKVQTCLDIFLELSDPEKELFLEKIKNSD